MKDINRFKSRSVCTKSKGMKKMAQRTHRDHLGHQMTAAMDHENDTGPWEMQFGDNQRIPQKRKYGSMNSNTNSAHNCHRMGEESAPGGVFASDSPYGDSGFRGAGMSAAQYNLHRPLDRRNSSSAVGSGNKSPITGLGRKDVNNPTNAFQGDSSSFKQSIEGFGVDGVGPVRTQMHPSKRPKQIGSVNAPYATEDNKGQYGVDEDPAVRPITDEFGRRKSGVKNASNLINNAQNRHHFELKGEGVSAESPTNQGRKTEVGDTSINTAPHLRHSFNVFDHTKLGGDEGIF